MSKFKKSGVSFLQKTNFNYSDLAYLVAKLINEFTNDKDLSINISVLILKNYFYHNFEKTDLDRINFLFDSIDSLDIKVNLNQDFIKHWHEGLNNEN